MASNMQQLQQQQKAQGPELEPFEQKFMTLIDQTELTSELYEQAIKDMDSPNFDAFNLEGVIHENSLQFMTFKIFKQLNFFDLYHIPLENVVIMAGELPMGYFKDNPYHCVTHIIDSMQGMSFLMTNGEVSKSLKKHDIFAAFVSCLIHDYEHPGFSN